MSFEAYIENIKAKTGKTPADFKKLAEAKGLLKPSTKAGDITGWLKEEFGLGHGHAMAIYAVFKSDAAPEESAEDAVGKHFAGGKAAWRPVFDKLLKASDKAGKKIELAPTNSYISLLNDGKKFAVVQVTTDRMDVGIKLKSAAATDRFETAGAWNTMMTHRVRISDAKQADKELWEWLNGAFDEAGAKKKAAK
jgi:hypothetical protein